MTRGATASPAPPAVTCPVACRVHMVAKLSKALDEVRAGEARRMVREGYEAMLKNKRRCLLKRPENLTDKQRPSLSGLAYTAEERTGLLAQWRVPAVLGVQLTGLGGQIRRCLVRRGEGAMRSRIDPVKKFVRTVRAHRELLLNYFRAKKQFSSGVIEGLNSQSHTENSSRLSDAPHRRTLPASRAEQVSRAEIPHRFF